MNEVHGQTTTWAFNCATKYLSFAQNEVFQNLPSCPFSGLGRRDPELEIKLNFSLLDNEMDSDHCWSVSKPDVLIHLSELDVTEPASKQILLHPFLLVYLHIYSQS